MKDDFYEPDPSLGKDINKMDVEELITLRESLKLYQYDKTEHFKDKLNKKPKLTAILKGVNVALCAGAIIAILACRLFSSGFILLASIAGVDGIFSGINFVNDVKYRLAYKKAINETNKDYAEKIEAINNIINKKFPNYKYKADAINIADQVITSMKEDSKINEQKEKTSTRLPKDKTFKKSQNDDELTR